MKQRVEQLLSRVKLTCLEKEFNILIKYDDKYTMYRIEDSILSTTLLQTFVQVPYKGRVYIQLEYNSKCNKDGDNDYWKGRKWYLSEHMTDDEIIKTCYAAFEACVKHEIMEGFKVDGKMLFNPHINFEALLSISDQEITRNKK